MENISKKHNQQALHEIHEPIQKKKQERIKKMILYKVLRVYENNKSRNNNIFIREVRHAGNFVRIEFGMMIQEKILIICLHSKGKSVCKKIAISLKKAAHSASALKIMSSEINSIKQLN